MISLRVNEEYPNTQPNSEELMDVFQMNIIWNYGFDIEMGCLNYKSMFLHNPESSLVDATATATRDDMALYSSLHSGKKITHGEVLANDTWGFAKKLVEKQYFEL